MTAVPFELEPDDEPPDPITAILDWIDTLPRPWWLRLLDRLGY